MTNRSTAYMYSIIACKFENVIFKAVQHNCHTKATYFVKAKFHGTGD